jgi:3-phosphoshikimate 1-carboxyvinyltransferase
MQQTTAKNPLNPLNGSVRAPGDKSMSHRAMIFGALAEGVTQIRGLLEGDDILRTIDAMRAFGAQIEHVGEGEWTVKGCGASGWKSPKNVVDFGNAGTGARLIMGAAAGFDLQASYKGDKSLSVRPMGRVLIPLSEMGACFESKANTLPIRQTQGGNLTALSHSPEHASAQVKSALLLAGLGANGTTDVTESRITRDHTENMLEAFGVPVSRKNVGGGQKVSITGPARLTATKVNIPGDPSSAAFLIAAALVVPGSDIVVENVMMNPARTGLFEVLIEMGAFLRADNFRRSGGETIADIHVKHSKLGGVSVPAARVPSMVDEYPVLAVVAAFARGTTEMRGLGELRVKESDRLTGTYDLLRLNGVSCDVKEDMLSVEGSAAPLGGGRVATHHDHRLAMSALVLGLGAQNPVSIDDAAMINTSFPSFFDLMDQIGAPIDKA